MTRPRHTKKDGNHTEIVRELREAGYIVIDVADLPGDPEHNPLDLFVAHPLDAPIMVAYNAWQIMNKAKGSPGWVQVEIKPHWGSRLTPNERAYLDARGVTMPPAPAGDRATTAERIAALDPEHQRDLLNFAFDAVVAAPHWLLSDVDDDMQQDTLDYLQALAELKGEP